MAAREKLSGSKVNFAQHGPSGQTISELLPESRRVADRFT